MPIMHELGGITVGLALFLTLPAGVVWVVAATATSTGTATATATAPVPAAVNIENDVLHFSYELAHWLDVDRRPCQDFYTYVCGRSVNSSIIQLEQRLQREQTKFDKFIWSDNDEQLLDAELKLKKFYDSCKNARGVEELKSSLMYRTTGGWPAIDDTAPMLRKRRSLSWLAVLGAFHEAGAEYFFRLRVELKSNRRVVHIEPDDSARYTLRKFEQLAGEVMQEYAVNADRARLIALEILSFERNRREIVQMLGATNELTEAPYSDFTHAILGLDLQEEWDGYFKKVLGKTLRPTDTISVSGMDRLTEMVGLMRNTTITRLLNWIWIDYLMDKSSANCQNLVQRQFEPVYEHIVQRSIVDRVQMAQMYADIGRAYDELLAHSHWVDEISQQNSKQFLGRIIHLTLNGDAKLDDEYIDLALSNRNFYRNLEKLQRLLTQKRRSRTRILQPLRATAGDVVDVSQAATEFMKIFRAISELLQQQNLTIPLNYALVGQRFAQHMTASGSSSRTAGAWRSMDSERQFALFKQCIARQDSTNNNNMVVSYNLNNLILKMLAQKQALQAFGQWQQHNAALVTRLNGLLAAGRLQLSLQKLYFVGSVLAECRQGVRVEQPALVHAYLRNSPEFTQAFGCRVGDALYVRHNCKI